jgi:hypothetical protein
VHSKREADTVGEAIPPGAIVGVVASSAVDGLVTGGQVHLGPQSVGFSSGPSVHEISCVGRPCWGGKCATDEDLSRFAGAPGVQAVPGGSLVNTSLALARALQGQPPLKVRAIDTAATAPLASRALADAGIELLPLSLNPAPFNLVFSSPQGHGQRLILKSAPGACAALNGQLERIEEFFEGPLKALLTNSAKSSEVVKRAKSVARRAHAKQYSVLTTALPAHDRIHLQLATDDATMANLLEFAEVAEALGVPCPAEEETASLVDVANAMVEVADMVGCRDLVVSLGRRGALGLDATTGLLCRVSLTPWAEREVADVLCRQPERVNGSGDRFFGYFCIAHVLFTRDPRTWSRVKHSLVQATREVVRSYSPRLHPDAGWFEVRVFSELGG